MNNKGIEKKNEGIVAIKDERKEFYIQLMKDYHSGNELLKKEAIDKMISAMNNYIYSVIRTSFPTYKKYTEDLYQEGVIAILKKLDTYDPELGTPSTYFHIYIKSEMNSFLINTIDHTTNHYGHNITKIKKVIEDFERKNAEYNNIDIAKKIGIPLETVIACRKIMNYSKEVSYDVDDAIKNQVPDMNMTPEERMMNKERITILFNAINDLDEVKKFIVVNKLELSGNKMSYKSIAKELGISIDKARKLYQEALREIKNKSTIKKYFGSGILTKEEKLLNEAEISFSDDIVTQDYLEGLEEILEISEEE